MRILAQILGAVHVIGYGCNVALLFYTEYILLTGNWWNLINPFFQLVIFVNVITNSYFWLFIAITAIGYFSCAAVERSIKNARGDL